MIYFISGHRDLTQLEFNKYYAPVLESVIERDPWAEFVVGDYEGVDSMAQDYLRVMLTDNSKVTVYHILSTPRNLKSNLFKTSGGYKTDEERDAAMTKASEKDIAFVRPGRRDSGTAQNLVRRFEKIG